MKRDSFVDQYTNKVAKAAALKKQKDSVVYRFCYVNKEKRVCVNTIYNGVDKPYFVLWNGQDHKTNLESFVTPDGETIQVPPISDPFYRQIYKQTVFPTDIYDGQVKMSDIDEQITKVLRSWFVQPDEYFIVARNYVKFSWVYERFRKNPYLYIFGDWGTGKSEWGTFIAWLCMYGQVLDDVSASALARILHMTGSTVFLDEADYIDGNDSEKIRRILRNGYKRGGSYIIAEQESGKVFMPKTYLVDQPKIIVKRKWIKDDALSTRMIPFSLIARDKDIPRSMRRSDEFEWEVGVRKEMSIIANLLLKWRWENIFGVAEPAILEGMNIRFNDTISPLIKLATEEDKIILAKYMKEQEKKVVIDVADDFRIQVVRSLKKIMEGLKNIRLIASEEKIFISDVVSRCAEDYGKEINDNDFKKIFHGRSVRRAMREMGIDTDVYANKVFVVYKSAEEMIPRIFSRYKIKNAEEVEAEMQEEQDKVALEAKKQEAEELLNVFDNNIVDK